MIVRARNRPAFTIVGIAILYWMALCGALVGTQTMFFRTPRTFDSDWWLFCIALAVVVLFSTICISICRRFGRERALSYAMAGAIGSLVVFAYFGMLAGSLSEAGFVWLYLPIGVVPGALQGIITYGGLITAAR